MSRLRIPLSGVWEFRFDDEPAWRSISVPGCWEALDGDLNRSGPAWYRTLLSIPHGAAGRQVTLRFDAVSYDCTVFVGGQLVGEHTGLWDAFTIDITGAVVPGQSVELLVRVEKPASLTAGPDSPPVAGHFPLRSTLAGFLPYVWGHIFGGIWQDVWLEIAGPAILSDIYVHGTPDGHVTVSAACAIPAEIVLELLGPDGELLDTQTEYTETFVDTDQETESVLFELAIDDPQPWSPNKPALYTVRLRSEGDLARVRFGLRELRTEGSDILLNGAPLYPRMILSWGWYAESLHSNPGPERVRADFEKLKALGYNGIKLCLWFPPQYYFDLADELGMLLWVELPMWLPQPDDHFRRQVPVEYEQMVRQSCMHPSVIIYSLGCELNRAVGPELLGPLYALVKRLAGDALVRDNSGSGEAYGGLLNEFADYYDYHFYSDLHFFRNLIDYFTPRWRPLQPWVFGEFCDLDTFRDPRKLIETHEKPAWWLSTDPAVNPQGARWQFDLPWHAERLRANAPEYWERSPELERLSAQHGLLHRKWTIETVRMYREIGGYVITGEVDTPISTAGMWDDAARLKFDPAAFSSFNGDLAILLGWDKRRAWVHGGDRAAYWDTWSYTSGAHIRPHLVASHYGSSKGQAQFSWSAAFAGEPAFAAGEATTEAAIAPGTLREVAVAEFSAPSVTTPRRATLRATLQIGTEQTENEWPLWFFPRDPWAGLSIGLYDPHGVLQGLERLAPAVQVYSDALLENKEQRTENKEEQEIKRTSEQDALVSELPSGHLVTWSPGHRVIIATEWTAALAEFVNAGGLAIVLLESAASNSPVPVVAMPFWREALRVAEPHPAWGDFPHDGWAGLQFFGCATDHALDTAAWGGAVRPILRRLDVRTMAIHDYAAELEYGNGRLIISTLRIAGEHGEQPAGIQRNIAAAYLLCCWARYCVMRNG